MARKKRIAILSALIALTVLIIIGILIVLYLKTDAFKTKETLFAKYMLQNFDVFEILKEDDEYLDYLSLGYKVLWNDERIYFPIDNADFEAIIENQRLQKIKLKKISSQYKESMNFMLQQILGQENDSDIRKTIKTIEKGA